MEIYPTPENKTFHSPTPGWISIVASTPNKNNAAPLSGLCLQMKQCGFNSALMTVTLSEINTALTNCGNAGIKPLLHHSHLQANETLCTQFVNAFKNNKNLGGWDLFAQPSYNSLTTPDGLSRFYDRIFSNDPNHCIFVSCVGGPVETYMNGKTYKEYLEAFQNILNPSFWPYVYYPIYKQNGKIVVMHDRFYKDLQIFSLLAKYTGRPFWAYVRSQAYKNASTEGPAPTESHIRFAAFSALAYGAQGLVYWTYRQRDNTSSETYSDAIVDTNGQKTPVWDYAYNVNHEIIALNHVFFGSELVECRHTGSTQYQDTCMLEGAIGPIESITTANAGVLISHLNTNGTDYLIIVNHDVATSQVVSINFNNYWKIWQLVFQNGTDLREVSVLSGTAVRTIKPGGYIIFKWE